MKYSVKKDKEKIISECNFTRRQEQVFLMKYIQKNSVSFIADELGYSDSMIHKELKVIRNKIERIWQ